MPPRAVEMAFLAPPSHPAAVRPPSARVRSHQKLGKLFPLQWFSELKEWMEAQMDIIKNHQSVDG